MSALLEIDGLSIQLPVQGEPRTVLHEVSFNLGAGQTLGLVGESGSGKSMTARAIARLLPTGASTEGRVLFDGADVFDLRGPGLRRYRAEDVSMIFQDPRAHINPVRRVGDFLTEVMRVNGGIKSHEANRRAIELLAEVGIPDGARRLRQYPHELSGGLLQRVMIAANLAIRPRLILADEPTTALDVTTQAEVMTLLARLQREYGMAMLFITHDLELAASVCDQTIVMYAGSVVEQQASARLHSDPLHPYTAALVRARPDVNRTVPRLHAIPGQPMSAYEVPGGCAFADRCAHAQQPCRDETPRLRAFGEARSRCRRTAELRGQVR
jgi:oligopeptide/dipeptide ABC transporter ATP-binding protein